jgi:hypothetical protein
VHASRVFSRRRGHREEPLRDFVRQHLTTSRNQVLADYSCHSVQINIRARMLVFTDSTSFTVSSRPHFDFLQIRDPNVMVTSPKSPRKAGPSFTASRPAFSRRPVQNISTVLREKIKSQSSKLPRFLHKVRQRGEERRWAARGGADEVGCPM